MLEMSRSYMGEGSMRGEIKWKGVSLRFGCRSREDVCDTFLR